MRAYIKAIFNLIKRKPSPYKKWKLGDEKA
jgi:hypothetical protein